MLASLVIAWQQSPIGRRYASLGQRERTLLMLCAIALCAAVGYSGIVAPIVDFRQKAIERYATQQADFVWMQTNQRAAELRLRELSAGTQVRVSTINSTANEFGLPLRRIQPEAGGFNVQIEAQPFGNVILWTHALDTRHGIAIQSATVDVYEEGLVNARFSLR